MLKKLDHKQSNQNQTKTPEQELNWATPKEIDELLAQYKREADALYKKTKLTQGDYQSIQSYILLVLYSGKYIIPRRSRDYTSFKVNSGFEKGGMLPDERSPLCHSAHGLIGMYKMVYFMGCVRILWPLRPGHFKPFDEKMLSQEEKNFVTEFHTIGFSPDIYPPLQNNVSSIVHFHSLLV